MIIILLFVIMLVLVILGLPIVYSIGWASVIILLVQGIASPTLLPGRMFLGLNKFMLSAIPFFLLSAELLVRGGLIKRLINFVSALIGHVRGGLAQVNIVASMIFAGIQASVTADSAAIGGVLIPAMTEEGYDKDLSVVVTATSSCCGPIIPPSILMILYGFLTGTSVAKLFLGGAIPGIIFGFSLMGITHYWVVKRGYKKRREKMASFKEIAKTGFETSPALLVPIIIVVGIVGGIVTPTEAGVLACIAAICVSFFYREITLSKVFESLKGAVATTAVILCVVAVSTVFSEILTRYLFSVKMVAAISFITSNSYIALLLMTIFIFFLGMVIDTTPLLIMLASPLYNAALSIGIDPVHLGVVLVMSALIGTISPPVSLILCLDCGIAKIPLSETFSIVWSYLLVMLAVVILCIFIPYTVTWLPSVFLQ